MTAPHAINRALERYGLKLTTFDLVNLSMECQKGYGRVCFLDGGRERHILMCHGKAVVAVYEPYTGPKGRVRHKHGLIITLLPPSAVVAGTRRAVNKNRKNATRRRKKEYVDD